MNLVLVGGTLLTIGGLAGVWTTLRSRQHGAPWRGDALTASALTVYGSLTLAGLVLNGTALGAVIVWVAAVATWAGLWVSRRERNAASR